MSNKVLLPNRYKKVGWVILIPSTVLGIILTLSHSDVLSFNTNVFAVYSDEIFGNSQYFSIINTDIIPTVVGVFFIIGSLLVSFSKEKNEDEFISKLRLSSLSWAVFVNYVLLLLSFIFIYGTGFLSVMLYNMFTILIIFIVRFNYVLYKNSKTMSDEK